MLDDKEYRFRCAADALIGYAQSAQGETSVGERWIAGLLSRADAAAAAMDDLYKTEDK